MITKFRIMKFELRIKNFEYEIYLGKIHKIQFKNC